MDKKLRDIVAAVALSLSQLVPYSAQAIQTQTKAPSGIEAIVENPPHEIRSAQYKLYHGYRTGIFDSLYRSLDYYLQQHMKDKQDTTKMVPLKWLNIFPRSVMDGVLGFTYLGDTSIWIRDDLTGDLKDEVITHKAHIQIGNIKQKL